MKAIHRSLAAALVVALCGAATIASAQPRKELREDRKERREDRKELHEDKKELREDRKDGASKEELREDKKEIREDKKELAEDRKEIREDRRAKREERRKVLREKWGDLTKRPEAIAELKVHARRMARLEHARKVADEAGKKEVVARVDKLIEKERARHQRSMDKLKEKGATAPAAAASAGGAP